MDGDCGRLADIYFDDRSWELKFWVLILGKGKSARSVVVEVDARDRFNSETRHLLLSQTVDQVEESLPAARVLPVSRQYEFPQKSAIAFPHLRSMAAIKGYACCVEKQNAGTVSDLLIQTVTWLLPYFQITDSMSKRTVVMHLPSAAVERLSAIANRVELRKFTPVNLEDDSIMPLHAGDDFAESSA